MKLAHSIAMTALLGALSLAGSALAAPTGAVLFAQNCSACHQAAGQGVPGAYPALAGNTFVRGDPKTVASVVLHGRGGMPSFSDDLSNADIAAVLTYVRSSWGNHASAVDPAVVAAARGHSGGAHSGSSVLPGH